MVVAKHVADFGMILPSEMEIRVVTEVLKFLPLRNADERRIIREPLVQLRILIKQPGKIRELEIHWRHRQRLDGARDFNHARRFEVVTGAIEQANRKLFVVRRRDLRRPITKRINHRANDDDVSERVERADAKTHARIHPMPPKHLRFVRVMFVVDVNFMMHDLRDAFENDEHDDEHDERRQKPLPNRIAYADVRKQRANQTAERRGEQFGENDADESDGRVNRAEFVTKRAARSKQNQCENPNGHAHNKDHLRKKVERRKSKSKKLRSTRGVRPSNIWAVKISIVVPAFNEERLLGESLAQIKNAARAFTPLGWEWELIVCDNNSTDKTAEIARANGAHVVFEPINQIARARNCGAAAASGDWIIFVDADSHPSADLFADAANAIQSGKYIAGGTIMRMDEKIPFAPRMVVHLWNLASRWQKLLAGSFIFCDTEVFRKIGGFNNELFCAEELELSQRLKKFAKQNGKRLIILYKHPLVTSARKMRLYSAREHLSMLFKMIFNSRRVMRSREQAHLWYDGRR